MRPGELRARVALIGAGLVALLALGTGCQSRTDVGECVGINDADRNPALHYRVSTRNVVLGIVFVETVFAPIVVLVSELYCPDYVKSRGGSADGGTVSR